MCGFELFSGLSALTFCPNCGANRPQTTALRCVHCGYAFKTLGQRLCEKCGHQHKPGQGHAGREKEPADYTEDQRPGEKGNRQLPATSVNIQTY